MAVVVVVNGLWLPSGDKGNGQEAGEASGERESKGVEIPISLNK